MFKVNIFEHLVKRGVFTRVREIVRYTHDCYFSSSCCNHVLFIPAFVKTTAPYL